MYQDKRRVETNLYTIKLIAKKISLELHEILNTLVWTSRLAAVMTDVTINQINMSDYKMGNSLFNGNC